MSKPTDCLIIGYNDGCLEDEVRSLRAMGADHPNYRDLSLNIIEYEGKPYRAMDIFHRFSNEARNGVANGRTWHNADVLWMVIMYLGTYLQKRGLTFDYINLFQLQKDELEEKLRKNEYLTTVVTTTIYNFDAPIIEVVKFVREHNPRTKIIVGGPYIAKRSETMDPPDLQAMFKYIQADFYVRSREGEQALVDILRALKIGQNFATIPNIAFKNGKGFVLTPSVPEMNPLYDNIIDYSLFPREQIGNYVNVRITKGCPFACAFCSFPLRTEKYDISRLDYIEHELNAIRNVETVSGLFFVDDTVNVPMGTFKEMLRMMIRKDYGFKWHCFFRADFCDEEVVELMAKAGCQGVFLGLESASDQLLANMNKTPRKEHYLKVIPLFKNAGIQVFASVFFGFPGETYKTAQETMDFLRETEPDFYRPLIWYCDPVTPIWRERDKYGIQGSHFSWSHNTMDVATACQLVERCFMSFDKPVWVPDPGFNFVSLYLMQNHGLTFDQIKRFLRSFSTVVKERISNPNRTEPSPALIENLRRACRIGRPESNDTAVSPIFSAESYRASESFFFKEFGSAPNSVEPVQRLEKALTRDDWRVGEEQVVSNDTIGCLSTDCDVVSPAALIAAYMASLWITENRKECTVALGRYDYEQYPIRLSVRSSATFRELSLAVQSKIEAAEAHRRFALRVLMNMRGMPNSVVSRPLLNAGYLEARQELGVEDRLRFPASVYDELNLILAVNQREKNWVVRFIYSSGFRGAKDIEDLGLTFSDVLKAAALNPETRIFQLVDNGHSAGLAVLPEEAPQFVF